MRKMILLNLLVLFVPVILYGQDKFEPPIWSPEDNLYGQYKVGPPAWSAGDNWTWNTADGALKSEVVKVEGGLYLVRMEGDSDLYAYDKKTMNVSSLIKKDGRKFPVDFIWRKVFDFPIFIGKRWQDVIVRKPAGGYWEATWFHEFRIDGAEDITVPAGAFKCYKIRLDLKTSRTHETVSVLYWYSPEVKNWIKRKTGHSSYALLLYDESARDAELISYKLTKK